MGDDRASVYVDGGKVVYRASSVGSCGEALLALRQGMDPMLPPEWLLEKYQEGTDSEDEIVEGARKEYNAELVSTQDEVEVEITDTILIRGHTDGRIQMADGVWGIEAKKLGPSLFGKWEAGLESFWAACPYYRDQLTIYMHGTGLPFLYAVGEWDPDEKKIKAVHVKVIDTPPGDINAIKAKVLRVEARFMGGETPECDGKAMWPCPVYYLHEEEEREMVVDEELEAAVEDYLEAAAWEKIAKDEKAKAMEVIEKLMEGQGDKVEIPGTAILSKYEHVSTSTDKDALKEAGIDLSLYQKQTRKPKVKVTAKEE